MSLAISGNQGPHSTTTDTTLPSHTLRSFLLRSPDNETKQLEGFPAFLNYATPNNVVTLNQWQLDLIKNTAKNLVEPYLESDKIAELCQKIAKTRDQLDLVNFFKKMQGQIAINNPPKLEGKLETQAIRIRAWMNINKPILEPVTTLDLSNSSLTSLPDQIYLFKNLETLNLAFNNISQTPLTLNMEKLREINVEGNSNVDLTFTLGLSNFK